MSRRRLHGLDNELQEVQELAECKECVAAVASTKVRVMGSTIVTLFDVLLLWFRQECEERCSQRLVYRDECSASRHSVLLSGIRFLLPLCAGGNARATRPGWGYARAEPAYSPHAPFARK